MAFRAEVTTGGVVSRAQRSAAQASRAVLIELFGRYRASFGAQAWPWPRETQRTKGTAGSPRNIIDVGNLRQTGTYQFQGPFTLEARWSANYATAVHEGARLRNGTILPARPWTAAVNGTQQVDGITPFPLAQRLGETWLAYLNAGR